MGNYLSRIAIAAGLPAVLSLTAGAATSEWKIDPQHSSAQFSVRHMA
ncbi:MAG: YceI family protein, partial [Acidobacteria bacterium]